MSSLRSRDTNWVFLTNWRLSFKQFPFSLWLYHLPNKPFRVNTLPCNKTMEGEKHRLSLMETLYGPKQDIMYLAFTHTPLATSKVSGKCCLSSSLPRKKKLVWWTAGPVVSNFWRYQNYLEEVLKPRLLTWVSEFLIQLVWNGPKNVHFS